MSEPLHDALDECLTAQAGQEDGLPACLDRQGEHRAELAGLLDLASTLSGLQTITARPSFRENAARRLVARLPEPAARPTSPGRWRRFRSPLFPHRNLRLAQVALALVFLLILSAAGTAYAADSAGPGDLLYGLDQAVERLQLKFAPDVESEARLRLEHANERLEEAQSKLQAGETEHAVTALDAYSAGMATLAQLVADSQGQDPDALQELVTTARSTHQDVLLNLPESVPDQARAAIQRAIEAGDLAGQWPDSERPAGPPAEAGPPDGVPAGQPAEPGAAGEDAFPGQRPPAPPEELLDDQPQLPETPADNGPPEQIPPGPPEAIPGDQPSDDESPDEPNHPGRAWPKIPHFPPGK